MDKDTMKFTCADGLIACSTNTALGGSTYCAASLDDCPVTDLLISNSTVPTFNGGANFVSRGGSNGAPYVYFTKTSNDRSNAPLMNINWQLGQLCAFTDQAAVVPSYNQQPVYYPLEAATNVESCRNLYLESENAAPKVGIDTRYANTTN